MILITRPSQPPAYAERAARGQAVLEATAAEGGFKSQRRYSFDPGIWLPARAVLGEASYDKCAWCESRVGHASVGEIPLPAEEPGGRPPQGRDRPRPLLVARLLVGQPGF